MAVAKREVTGQPRRKRPSTGHVRDNRTRRPRAVPRSFRPATVAIVGRPNVGKSALFNRLIGQRLAIVEDTPGVTRDAIYSLADWRGRTFTMVDTAGIDPDANSGPFDEKTRKQAEAAAADADVVIFVVDAAAGMNPLDDDVVRILRRHRRPVVLVANKSESPRVLQELPGEFARLGLGEPIPISALHGEGIGDLLDAVVERLPEQDDLLAASGDELKMALIGQPNVGKSSLLNSLIKEERSIVSDVPGTTRDALDTIFEYGGKTLRLIDTAGLRRKPTIHGSIEYYASLRALAAIARSDIALLLLDVMQGPRNQDRRLAGIVIEERKGLIIIANKWDLAREQGEYSQAELSEAIYVEMPFARFAPIVFLSALTRRRLGSLMPVVSKVAENLDRRVPDRAAERNDSPGGFGASASVDRWENAAHLLCSASRDPSTPLHLSLQRSGFGEAVVRAIPRKHSALRRRLDGRFF